MRFLGGMGGRIWVCWWGSELDGDLLDIEVG